MTAKSAARAATMNGVAPAIAMRRKPRKPCVGGFRRSRAFGSAPCASSASTSSSLPGPRLA